MTETTLALPDMNDHEALVQIQATTRDPSVLTEALQVANQRFNLVTPSPTCPVIPEGFGISVRAVLIDVDQDTYKVPGGRGRGLSKTALNKIAQTAGVTWNPSMSGRLDDASDPYYCHYRAVGMVRDFDGTPIVISGEKVMDLRDGSPTAKNGGAEIGIQRKFILEHAETKAKLRAIRSGLSLRTSYSPADLEKPFIVAKLTVTGETDDDDLRREFSRMRMATALGATQAMFGTQPGAQALPAPVQDVGGVAPVGETPHPPPALPDPKPAEAKDPKPARAAKAKTTPVAETVNATKAKQAASKATPAKKDNPLWDLHVPKSAEFGDDGGKTLRRASSETITALVTKCDGLLEGGRLNEAQENQVEDLRKGSLSLLDERGVGPGSSKTPEGVDELFG